MDRRRFRGHPAAVDRRLPARASLSAGRHATDTGAGLRRSVRARRLPSSASGIPLVAKEPHVAEPQEGSNGEDTSAERHHGSSRHEQNRSVERSLPNGDGHHRPAHSDAWHLRPAAWRSVGDSRKGRIVRRIHARQ